LLAVVADVDSGSDLPADDIARRSPAGGIDGGFIDGRASGSACVKLRQSRRAWQAASMCRQDAVFAVQHARSLPLRAEDAPEAVVRQPSDIVGFVGLVDG
jgi:hypothetical protein